MSTVLISGGTGLVGQRLSAALSERGYEVMLLSRKNASSLKYSTYTWNPEEQEIAHEAIARADYVVNLAGVNISEKKWTNTRKQEIADSRVKSGQLLTNSIRENNKKIKAFISASAVGYYGAETSEKVFSENDSPASDFLGNTCETWEKPAGEISKLGIRSVILRIGVVLAREGGALPKMMLPIKYGVGSALGDGKQYIPWIHIDDLVGILIQSIEAEGMNGSYNAVAPESTNNESFMRLVANILKKPFFLPKVPATILRMLLGEMAVIVLEGSRVSAEKIIESGYKFVYPELNAALRDLLLDLPQDQVN
ncbi:MAG: TIGR01777 family protein [Candidatus Marinimicrobia bacterium]|nr:TIGR01777 family protein [Candidatus Neomarinimicrobiota bacterium]